MTKEEKIRQRDAEIDQIIDRFDMTAKCGLTREQIHQRVIKGMVRPTWHTSWPTLPTPC